ncbi:hypothetical protein P3X46_034400, partial [Hevea brasiliensis]
WKKRGDGESVDEFAYFQDNTIKKLDTIVPIIPLIGSLAKTKFCNAVGHPISKPIRADSSDSDILDRFVRICRNLSHYYSGSSKKKKLYAAFGKDESLPKRNLLILSQLVGPGKESKSDSRSSGERNGSSLNRENGVVGEQYKYGESPVAESITSLRSDPSSMGHVESRVNQQGPPCKAKYSWVTDSEVVP